MIHPDAPLTYIPDFFSEVYATDCFKVLQKELDWERRDSAPRFEYWTNIYNRPYTYGRGAGERTYESKPRHPLIKALADWIFIDGIVPDVGGLGFEGCFLNMYVDGTDSLGWHADDDKGIDHTRPIAVVTLGAGRRLEYKKIGDKGHADGVFLTNGSLLLMHAGMQQTHLHRIPKDPLGKETGPRISLTYRPLVFCEEF